MQIWRMRSAFCGSMGGIAFGFERLQPMRPLKIPMPEMNTAAATSGQVNLSCLDCTSSYPQFPSNSVCTGAGTVQKKAVLENNLRSSDSLRHAPVAQDDILLGDERLRAA